VAKKRKKRVSERTAKTLTHHLASEKNPRTLKIWVRVLEEERGGAERER